MYSKRQGLILGFHGCTHDVMQGLLNKSIGFKPSRNEYDWLGNGMYFWEHNPRRARTFIEEKLNREKRSEAPAVIGAIIDMGSLFDLMREEDLGVVKNMYGLMIKDFESQNKALPQNLPSSKQDIDFKLRELDCAVFEYIHRIRAKASLPPFDSVRGVFWEGDELYPNAGFRDKNHVQVCVRNPNCILGFFLPKEVDEDYPEI